MRNSGVLKQRAQLQKAHCEQYSFALKKEIKRTFYVVPSTYHAAGCCDTRVASLSSAVT